VSRYLRDREGTWHIPAGRGDPGDWRPIRCGGGIVAPGNDYSADEVTERGGDVCLACLAASTPKTEDGP
jgi:hypothetical protein